MKINRLMLAGALIACAPAFAQNAVPPAAVSRITANNAITGTVLDTSTLSVPTDAITPEAMGDRGLLSQVVTALAADPRLAGAQINVQVAEGRVTLGGVVRDMAQSQTARAVADGIAGSANVTNSLTTGG